MAPASSTRTRAPCTRADRSPLNGPESSSDERSSTPARGGGKGGEHLHSDQTWTYFEDHPRHLTRYSNLPCGHKQDRERGSVSGCFNKEGNKLRKKKERDVRVSRETDLPAPLLLDVLHRKDVLSRGGDLHLDDGTSSSPRLRVWSRPGFSAPPLMWFSGANPPSSLAFAATPSAGELGEAARKTIHAHRRARDVRGGGGSNGGGLFPCCVWNPSEKLVSRNSLL